MITRLWLKNYGPFKDAILKLGPLSVLVGPNASGKSIALAALHKLLQAKPGPAHGLASMKRRGADQAAVEVGFVTHDEDHGMKWRLSGHDKFSSKLKLENPPAVLLIHLQPQALRSASYIDSEKPLMKSDGYGLATVLAYMKLSNSEGFATIESRTRAIVPTFRSLRFKRSKVENAGSQAVYGDELVFDMKGASGLSSTAVSDGTLLTLGLLTMTMEYSAKDEEPLFLVDEFERGLHPRALGELVSQLRRLSRESNVQILATSHSPYLVDALEPDEVRLTGLLDDGTATICNLTDHPDFERWKEEMSPGEFWSTVGEDWIK
jgi:predicted ATPase